MASTYSSHATQPPPAEVPAENPSTTTPPLPTTQDSSISASTKPIHTLVLDTGPLIKNDPPVSTLLASAEELCTLPSVLSEIKDAATRSRVETTLLPFVKLRSPRPESIKFVTDFARRTGDLEVLSRPDVHLIALTYELECERNGGDWRLRSQPAQKGINGRPAENDDSKDGGEAQKVETAENAVQDTSLESPETLESAASENATGGAENATIQDGQESKEYPVIAQEAIEQQLSDLSLQPAENPTAEQSSVDASTDAKPDDDDEDGWITPFNLKKHQDKDALSVPEQPIQTRLQVALLTSDYAMQNVLLRVGLNLVSPTMARITHVKTWVLRCHGCFQITKNTSKQFCPSCGQPTLTRVSCSTDDNGKFQIHLKRNFQWNNRGNVYSVPKPMHGSSNGKMREKGGGQNGWGRDLILAEDQKEYEKKKDSERRTKARDIMDEDYLPSILTGNRNGGGGRIRVGAGRNVNSKKRR